MRNKSPHTLDCIEMYNEIISFGYASSRRRKWQLDKEMEDRRPRALEPETTKSDPNYMNNISGFNCQQA